MSQEQGKQKGSFAEFVTEAINTRRVLFCTRVRHQCHTCGKSYKQKSHLNYHQRMECNKEPAFCCPFCPHRTKQKSGLKSHVVLRHRDQAVIAAGGSEEGSVEKLMWLINNKWPGDGTHPGGRIPTWMYYLVQVDGRQKFVCARCSRQYKYRRGLGQHLRYECGKPPLFKCVVCPYRANQKGAVTAHQRFKHGMTFSKNMPGLNTIRSVNLEANFQAVVKTESTENDYVPQFILASVEDLATADPTKHVCQQCGRVYKQKSTLAFHLRYECGKEPQFSSPSQPQFPCSCGRVYKQKTGLVQHQRYECGKEPQFQCHLCSYKGKRKTSLQSHLMFRHKQVDVKKTGLDGTLLLFLWDDVTTSDATNNGLDDGTFSRAEQAQMSTLRKTLQTERDFDVSPSLRVWERTAVCL
ncbi:zinc finger protein 567-like [Macrosteles quadrilineatus]|uniref:zinc finger protein 567-like n=1 Tax=Macrosteles quadrilineatus TaxID=74068 RepID=UPI0023E188A4|nr:zinc finger protein 567-like [Macrosteles quadrilineatus]